MTARPDIVVVTCCGFSRERASNGFQQLNDDPEWLEMMNWVVGRVYVTDGNAYFSRPGPRLVDGLEALAHALHPAIHPPSKTAAQVVLADRFYSLGL